ncbi:MAG: FAD-dependent thymidylate synthase [archaeon]
MKVELIRMTENPVEAMANAARESYNSETDADKLVRHVLGLRHYSIAEFMDIHLRISGVSRALTHQLVRHRHFSFNQRSQRYIDESEFDIVIPESVKNNNLANYYFMEALNKIQIAYNESIKAGIPKEDARYILPNATETIIHFKGNLRSLIEFFHKRACKRAQWEIRELATQIKLTISRKLDNEDRFLINYLTPKCISVGYCEESKKSCGMRPLKVDVFDYYERYEDLLE